MADRGKTESTPPPLLLMPAGGGLTLNPPEQPNVLMPVVQSDHSLLGPEEEGEADSFLGQSPPTTSGPPQTGTLGFFSHPSATTDPFANVGQNPHPPNFQSPAQPARSTPPPPPVSHQGQGPYSQIPPFTGQTQPPFPTTEHPPANIYRQQGRPRYAQPPPGTYAPQVGQQINNSPFSLPIPPPARPPTISVPNSSANQGMSQSMPPPQVGVSTSSSFIYEPVQPHWCYCKLVENKEHWYPFSVRDSINLEDASTGKSGGVLQDPDNIIVATDGGRYDVVLKQRERHAVYWDEAPTSVRRCVWFYKRESDNRYVPYEEYFAQKLEEEYRNAVQNNVWHKRLEFPGGETIVMHNPKVIVHFQASSQPDEWGTVQSVYPSPGDQMRPSVVKRGINDFTDLEDGEPLQIDHLVFVVHGIGPICDVKFRNIVECVDDFRSISLSLIKTHFKKHVDAKRIGRVEFIPVHWHSALHGDTTGIDERLKAITLPSTAKLRHFVNDTLLDILFYTSPAYCQCIADTVGSEMNRLHKLFMKRNPNFGGSISVAGHSLGSSIVFDLLLHQRDQSQKETTPEPGSGLTNGLPESSVNSESAEQEICEDKPKEMTLEELLEKVGLQDKLPVFQQEQIDMESLTMCSESDLKDLGLPLGPRKKLQGIMREEEDKKKQRELQAEQKLKQKEEEERKAAEQKKVEAAALAQLPHEMLRRVSSVQVNFLQGLAGTGQPFVKYPQLKFHPATFFALGSPIGVFLSVRGVENVGDDFRLPTCPRVFNIFHPFDPVAYRLEPLVNSVASNIKPVQIPHHKGRKRLHLELRDSIARVGNDIKQKIIDSLKSTWNSINDFAKAHRNTGPGALEEEVDQGMSSVMEELAQHDDDNASLTSSHDEDISVGLLNEGRRIDYVLQERPIESFNDYLFALASHGCYWESEDTVLLVLKELYDLYGIIPQMPGPETLSKPPLPANTSVPPLAGSAVPQQFNMQQPPPFSVSQTPSQYRPTAPAPRSSTPPQYGQMAQTSNSSALPQFGQVATMPNVSMAHQAPTAVGPPPMCGFMRQPPKL